MPPFNYRLSALKKCFATNSVGGALPALTGSLTKPSGNGVHDLTAHNRNSLVWAKFYCTDAGDAGNSAVIRLTQWDITEDQEWYQSLIFQADITAGTKAGLSGFTVDTDSLWIDEIAITAGTAIVDLHSPADNTEAWVVVPFRGSPIIQWESNITNLASVNGFFNTR